MTDEEARDVYRLGKAEQAVEALQREVAKIRRELDAVEDWKADELKRDQNREKKLATAINAVIVLGVSILSSAVAVLLGHL